MRSLTYNTAKEPLVVAEYGRNVQNMVNYIKTLDSRDKRSQAASTLVDMIFSMTPNLRDQEESRQKVWDHIYMIADYDLDIDSPFPTPEPPSNEAPEKMPYPQTRIMYRYYGKNVESLINKAIAMEPSHKRDYFVNSIASYMKMAYRIFNVEKVSDEIILEHLRELSGNKLNPTQIVELTQNYDTKIHKPSKSSSNRPKGRKKKRR